MSFKNEEYLHENGFEPLEPVGNLTEAMLEERVEELHSSEPQWKRLAQWAGNLISKKSFDAEQMDSSPSTEYLALKGFPFTYSISRLTKK